jgi:hypothetical protein
MESNQDKIMRVEAMASGEPSWDLSENDMAALQYVLTFVPGSDYFNTPAEEN